MKDLERAKVLLRPIYQQAYKVLDELWDIVGRNQNPGCGGDLDMTPEEWLILRDSADQLRDFLLTVRRLRRQTLAEGYGNEQKKLLDDVL